MKLNIWLIFDYRTSENDTLCYKDEKLSFSGNYEFAKRDVLEP